MAYEIITNCSTAEGLAKIMRDQRESTGVKDGSLTLRLPAPHHCLNPNSRSHWGTKARHTKILREAAQIAALGAGIVFNNPLIDVKLYRKYKRRSDRDNVIASLKGAVDGLADAKLFANDDLVRWGDVAIYVDKDDPRCIITITEYTLVG